MHFMHTTQGKIAEISEEDSLDEEESSLLTESELKEMESLVIEESKEGGTGTNSPAVQTIMTSARK